MQFLNLLQQSQRILENRIDESSFDRLPGHVIGNELYTAEKELSSILQSQMKGNDFDKKRFALLIKKLQEIQKEAKTFTSKDEVPVSYLYKEEVEAIEESTDATIKTLAQNVLASKDIIADIEKELISLDRQIAAAWRLKTDDGVKQAEKIGDKSDVLQKKIDREDAKLERLLNNFYDAISKLPGVKTQGAESELLILAKKFAR